MRLYGCRAVEGDLVLLPPAPAPGKGEGASNKEKPRARALTQAEVEGAKGEGLLYEVVLPLPGPGVEMPGGGVGEVRAPGWLIGSGFGGRTDGPDPLCFLCRPPAL